MKRQGRVVSAEVITVKELAGSAALWYRTCRENGGKWDVRVHPRTVRANSVALPVWVVIVREKAAATP